MNPPPTDRSSTSTDHAQDALDAIYRSESRAVLATLIRLLGDFDLADEALHDAFKAALEQWPRDGVPANPRAWLVSTGRFKASDAIRKHSRLGPWPGDIAERLSTATMDGDSLDNDTVEDDRLRLIFTCCHPALGLEAQIALRLGEVCGLTTGEIGRAFLTAAPTLAQRIVRAKAKIRNARIPYQVPARADLRDRLDAVLRVVYPATFRFAPGGGRRGFPWADAAARFAARIATAHKGTVKVRPIIDTLRITRLTPW